MSRPSHKQFKEDALAIPDVKKEYDQIGEIIGTCENGLAVYRKSNGAGGYMYIGESCSVPALLWDSSIGTIDEFLIIAKDCYGLKITKSK